MYSAEREINQTMNEVIVLVPIYARQLSAIEAYSLDHSLMVLNNRRIAFIGPQGLDTSYYRERYPDIQFTAFEDHYFSSIIGYNRLLLSESFYARFSDHEFMLILQTDAIILSDDLSHWCASPFDYVGAPWPEGVEVFANAGLFEGNNGKRLRAHVGNGGLSLRRVGKCIKLLQEHAVFLGIFDKSGSSEDLFFSLMGQISNDFLIPNEITASRFSLELRPSYYLHVNGGNLPMGGHAWWKYEPGFWQKLLPAFPESVYNCINPRLLTETR